MDFRNIMSGNLVTKHVNRRSLHPHVYTGEWFHRLHIFLPNLKAIILDGLDQFNNLAGKVLCGEGPSCSRDDTDAESLVMKVLYAETGRCLGGEAPVMSHHHIEHEHIPVLKPLILSMVDCRRFDLKTLLADKVLATPLHLSNLVYLDVSGIAKVSSLSTAPGFAVLPKLRILKMQKLAITDAEIVWLIGLLGTQLFSLDLRNNSLTDLIIPHLLELFLPPINLSSNNNSIDIVSPSRSSNPEQYLDAAPAYSERSHPTEEQETAAIDHRVDLRLDDADSVTRYLLNHDGAQRGKYQSLEIGTDFSKKTGLTNLYLANNKLTSSGVKRLLDGTNRLQLLDVGSVQCSRPYANPAAKAHPNLLQVCQPDTVNILSTAAANQLQELRVHHSVVTHCPTLVGRGEYHISEERRTVIAEGDYAPYELRLWPMGFLPDTNPRVKRLTLSHVPRKSLGLVVDHLLMFLHAASVQESAISNAKGPSVGIQLRGPKMLSGLRYMCLEFIEENSSNSSGPSISGDIDADEFARQSQDDFSFFGSEQSVEKKSRKLSNDKLPRLRDVKEELRAYRQQTMKAFEAESEKLGVPAWRVPLGAPHYHWSGELICK